jgi:uncharacterized protein YbjT (DUF2867 family)
MSKKIASVVGATGLIGSELLKLLLDDPYFETVRVIVRRPFNLNHPKLEKKLVDFDDGDSMLVALDNSDVVFCALGTTQKKVKGDKNAYRKVDYDIPVNAARYCRMTGCNCFVVVSSLGANSKSKNFYIRLKGEMEEAVKVNGPKTIHVMRPSMLLGKRNESRPAEKIGQGLMRAFAFFIPKKYKAIKAKAVARAMVNVAKQNGEGFFIHENDSI